MSEENQNTEQIAPTTESDDNVDYKALYLSEMQNAKNSERERRNPNNLLPLTRQRQRNLVKRVNEE